MKMKLNIPALILGALLLVGAGVGGISTQNLDNELRTHVVRFFYEVAADGNDTVGADGLICSITTNGVTSASCATFVNPPYPAKLDIRLDDDGGASSALTCTQVVVTGRDQFGRYAKETVSGIDESESLSTYAYEQVTAVDATGCANGADSSDMLKVAISDHPATSRILRSNSDLIAVCKYTSTVAESGVCKNGSAFTVDRTAQTLDLGSGSLSPSAGDTITIRTRPLYK